MRNRENDYGQVEDVSGAAWDGALLRPRDRALTPPPPPGPLPHRQPVLIDGETGQVLGEATASTVRRFAIHRAIDQTHPAAQPMLDHIFGIGLPGR